MKSLSLLCLGTSLLALEVPQGGVEVSAGSALQSNASPTAGTSTALEKGARQIHITAPDEARIFSAQFTQPITAEVRRGEWVLAIIKARAVDVPNGEVMAKLQLRGAPFTALAESRLIGVHPEWTELPVAFQADAEIQADSAAIVLLCGHKQQKLQVETIRVLKYAKDTDPALFPKVRPLKRTYEGREPDAPWRKAALERIEQHRKADLQLTLKAENGKPMPNQRVRLQLQRHAFGFGSAVVARRFSSETPDDLKYREVVDRLFSIVVFENDLKDGQWPPDLPQEQKDRRNAELDAAFHWLKQRNIGVRGHYLMQVATPYNLHGIQDSSVIQNRILGSVRERMAFVKDRVIEWDVINHPIAWSGADMLNRRPGLEHLDREVFTLSRSLTKLPFYVNEDQVFRPGPQCDETYTYIEALKKGGFDVAGLGNQAHFHESYLPSPEHLLSVTDRFAQIVPAQSITEYDVVTTEDEELAADYTRDVLISVFSHPAYSSFLLWGFWEGSHWKPEAASWGKDWQIRPRGAVLEEWIKKRWHTDVELMTDAEGKVAWRGFPGWYEVEAEGKKSLHLAQQGHQAVD